MSSDPLAAGDPKQALAEIQNRVRAEPGNAEHRRALFGVLCLLGEWDRASTHLDTAGKLDPETVPMAVTYGLALKCESLRRSVFAGERAPMLFGQPAEWVAPLIEGVRAAARGEFAQAAALRDQAFADAPSTRGKLNGQPFEYVFDPDSRLGPMLEAIVDGKYFWMPFERLRKIELEPPAQAIDLVWAPAELTFANGGKTPGLIPVRYPGSEESDDPRLQLARLTAWDEKADGYWFGVGARVLETDREQFALLDVRELELASVGESEAEGAEQAAT